MGALLLNQELTPADSHSGKRCERLTLGAGAPDREYRVAIDIPPARALDELKATLWIKSSCPGVRLGLRLRLPHQIDPATGAPLALDLIGDAYSTPAKWQQLSCSAEEAAIRSRLIRARAQLREERGLEQLNEQNLYVDQVVVLFQVIGDTSLLQFDDLAVQPIFPPRHDLVATPAATRLSSPLKFLNDRIWKGEQPHFLLFTVYHGESLDDVSRSGVNALWIPDYQDRPLVEALSQLGLGILAQPPQLSPQQAVLNRAGLPPFSADTASIWAWILGVEIPGDDCAYVTSWANQVRDADRELKRPILADVSGQERAYHRHLDLLGSSRFTAHSAASPATQFEQLRQRRNLALPGKPMFTFVQIEPSEALLDHRSPGDALPVVEPEQILHHSYAAIAAGFKAIGFWKQIPLNEDAPGLNERIHALRIFALHCRILEPWLATSRVLHDLDVQVDGERVERPTGMAKAVASRWDSVARDGAAPPLTATPLRVTALRTDLGLMILPIFHDPQGQCAPGPQSLKNVRIRIRGDYTQAWEVTPTSVEQRNLTLDRVAGGTELCLKEFDRHTVIVLPERPQAAEELRRSVQLHRREAAEAFLALTELKLVRTAKTHAELMSAGVGFSQGDLFLRQASLHVEQARQELQAEHSDEARLSCQRALLQLRTLQRREWDAAVATLCCPTESLAATCHHTLPDHWRLMSQVSSAAAISENRLPSGDFENEAQLHQLWRNGAEQNRSARLIRGPGGVSGGMQLTLAQPADVGPDQAAILLSPEIAVQHGEIVIISGQIQLPQPLRGPECYSLISETMTGATGGLRFEEATAGWKSFRIIRRVSEDGAFRIRCALYGPGVAQFDDFRVRIIPGPTLRPANN